MPKACEHHCLTPCRSGFQKATELEHNPLAFYHTFCRSCRDDKRSGMLPKAKCMSRGSGILSRILPARAWHDGGDCESSRPPIDAKVSCIEQQLALGWGLTTDRSAGR